MICDRIRTSVGEWEIGYQLDVRGGGLEITFDDVIDGVPEDLPQDSPIGGVLDVVRPTEPLAIGRDTRNVASERVAQNRIRRRRRGHFRGRSRKPLGPRPPRFAAVTDRLLAPIRRSPLACSPHSWTLPAWVARLGSTERAVCAPADRPVTGQFGGIRAACQTTRVPLSASLRRR